jgi:hypothetical protein
MRGFFGMAAVVLCLALLVIVSGCATLHNAWDGDVRPEATRAALCRDAQLGIQIADLALEANPTGELAIYWQRWRAGAVMAFQAYCLGSK